MPDARELFIEVTEAYEYLLRLSLLKKSRMEPEPESYAEEWQRYEKPNTSRRAEKFSGMRYRDFKHTGYYKATRIANEIYLYVFMLLGTIIVLSVFFGFMNQLKDPRSGIALYLMDLMILAVGVVFITFSIFQLMDMKTEGQKSK